ncbi:hypothetical protein KIL84_007817 [Mauremys mutica]|uniref:Uncharacterized protein n=1 Tax=Mauremys mutica TaxID=74926 RepID=A0A9D4AVZ7_9SAUR|nr:hypothetical protein KIL84_007817 [Mauremys mutica]
MGRWIQIILTVGMCETPVTNKSFSYLWGKLSCSLLCYCKTVNDPRSTHFESEKYGISLSLIYLPGVSESLKSLLTPNPLRNAAPWPTSGVSNGISGQPLLSSWQE